MSSLNKDLPTESLDPMRGAFGWAIRRGNDHLRGFVVGGVLLGIFGNVAGQLITPPQAASTPERIAFGVGGFLAALIVAAIASYAFALVRAPFEQRDALREELDAMLRVQPPRLRMSKQLEIDTGTPNHAAYLRLRLWNDGGGSVRVEVRVTKVILEGGAQLPFIPQLPLPLGWSHRAQPPRLTKNDSNGETVGVMGVVAHRVSPFGTVIADYRPPLLYIAGATTNAEIGSTSEKIFLEVQAVAPDEAGVVPIEQWFSVQVVDEGSGNYEVRTEDVSAPPELKSPLDLKAVAG